MPEETRVFDVTKPSQVNPSATSKPVIVGHHPVAADPMVKDDSGFLGTEKPGTPQATAITVTDGATEEKNVTPIEPDGPEASEIKVMPVEPPLESTGADSKTEETENAAAVFSAPADSEAPSAMPEETPVPEVDSASSTTEATEMVPPSEPSPSDTVPPADQFQPHIEQLHFNEPKHKRRMLPIVAIILALLIGAYLAADAGVFGSGINLPVHVFKQKTSTPPPAPVTPAKPSTPSTPLVPTGFKQYKIAGTSLTFAAPTTWGDPTSSPESGYSKRGGDNKSDGTYAYVVTFATNKDVEIAVTSAKYLPSTRATLYYDYLQWCSGTNDGKFYKSILHFTTADKVDTPTTITCDQGPLADAQKLDSSTIVQPKTKDSAGKDIGDLYTKNLNNKDLVVFRVKDAAMTNGDVIKQLLGTVKIPAASSSTSNQ